MVSQDPVPIQLSLLDHDPKTVVIQLTQGHVAIIDIADADLADLKWQALETRDGTCYAKRGARNPSVNKQYTEYLHRVILERKLGRSLEKGEFCDHDNRNKLDNRRKNLRLATPSQNSMNSTKKANNTSGYKGVSWNVQKKKWSAIVSKNGKHEYVAFFNTPEEAHEAYRAAAQKLHGEFARYE